MADFRKWTDEEIGSLQIVLVEVMDRLTHEPYLWTTEEQRGLQEINADLYREARNRKFWWAQY